MSVPSADPAMVKAALAVAIATAHEAGALVRQGFSALGKVDFKGAVNPVTETDRAAERLIRQRLQAHFPTHRVLGEEYGEGQGGGAAVDPARPRWFIDPLDGTNNFAHGFPHFAISLALQVAGTMVVGVIYDPLRDETFTVRRDAGAMCNGKPIHVSATARLQDAFLATGFPYDRRVAAANNVQTLDHFLRRSLGVRRAGSAALDLAYVACGRFDGFWEPRLSPWDVAAGVLLVEEAGGRASDFGGARTRLFSGEEVVASNGHIHQEMLRVLREGPAAPHPDLPLLRSV